MSSAFFRRREEPTKQEIHQSQLYSDVQSAFKDFEAETNQIAKQNLFTQFMINFDSFIVLETNKKLVNKFVPQYVKEMFHYSQYISGTVPCLIQAIKILTKAVATVPGISIKPKFICMLLENCCRIAELYPSIIQISDQFFRTVINDDDFFEDFVSHGCLELMFEKIFVSLQNEKSGKFFNSLLFDNASQELYQCVNFSTVIEFVTSLIADEKITPEMAECVSLFISNMFRMVSANGKQTSKFLKSNSITLFDYIVQCAPFEKRIDCYRPMLLAKNEDGTPPPNISVYKHINNIFNENPHMQTSIFYLVCDIVQNNAQYVMKLDESVPMQNWFNWATPSVNDLVMLLVTLDNASPALVKKCLPVMFKGILRDKTCKAESILLCTSVIEHQISEKMITYMFLLETNFLSAFVIEISHENIQYILSQSTSFKQLIIDVYALDGAMSFRPSVFKAILEICNEETVEFVSSFFAVDPSEMCIRILLDYINKTMKNELLQVLISVFVSCKEAATNFVNAGGIKWAFSKLPIQDLTELLSSLVCTRRFNELEDEIAKLPPEHPLFSQSEEVLEKIVFGLNHAQYKPIRVHSLFCLLKNPVKLDPYNAWLLGSSFIDQSLKKTDDIFQVPMIDQIANRLLDIKFLDKVLEKPYNIERFCNPNYDHFQLFQFYPGNGELSFNVQCASLSFWFRFPDENAKAHDFFRTNIIRISLINKRLMIQCDDNKEELAVDPSTWYLVAIKLDSSLMSSTLVLYVNDRIYTFQLKTKKNVFSSVHFGAASQSLCFLGSAIRLLNSPLKDFNALYQKGPSYISAVQNDELIITPNSARTYKHCKIPPNCVLVPYEGFPIHFISFARVKVLLNAMEKAPDQEKFEAIFHTLLNLQEITQFECEQYYRILYISLTKCAKNVTEEVFRDLITSELKSRDSADVFEEIIYNKKMWHTIDNVIMITTILSLFNEKDFKSIDCFEIFLMKKIVANKCNQKIVSAVLSKSKILKTSVKYLLAILRSASSEMQCNIIEAITKFVTKETVESVTKIVPYNDIISHSLIADSKTKMLIIDLITEISQYDSNYVLVDKCTLKLFADCVTEEKAWKDALSIIDSNKNTELYSIVIILVASGAICTSYGGKIAMLEEGIRIIREKIDAIVSNKLCCSMIIDLFPVCLNFSEYIEGKKVIKEVSLVLQSISKDFFTSQDRIWPEIEKITKSFEYTSTRNVKINPVDFFKVIPIKDAKFQKDATLSINDLLQKASQKISSSYKEFTFVNSFIKEIYSREYEEESVMKAFNELIERAITSLCSEFILKEELFTWTYLEYEYGSQQRDINSFNHSANFLTSKCFPFSYPKVLVPFTFASRGDGFRVYSAETSFRTRINKELGKNMLEMYIKMYGNNEVPLEVFQATLVRYNEQINCVVFIFAEFIDILTFSALSINKDTLILQDLSSPQIPSFIDEVMNGEWGKTSIFAGRVVVKLHVHDIIFISNPFNEGTSFCFWCFTIGCFELRLKKADAYIATKLAKVCAHSKALLPPNKLLFNIKTREEVMERFESGIISCHDAVLALNALANHYFVDPVNGIIFPQVGDVSFPPLQELIGSHFNDHFNTFYKLERDETPKMISEFATESLGYPAEKPVESKIKSCPKPIIRHHIGLINNMHVFSKLSINPKGNLIYDFEEIAEIPKLSEPIGCTRDYILTINKAEMSLAIINNKTKSAAFRFISPQFIYATNIDISSNGLFVVIDYNFCVSRTFRIIYSDGAPCILQPYSELSFFTQPHSCISGTDSVCCTALDKKCITWNPFNGQILRSIEFEENVTCAAIDEESSLIWCSTKRHLHIITINGSTVISKEMPSDFNVSVIEVVPLPFDEFHRTAFIGLENGKIFCVQYLPESSRLAIKALESPHTSRIRSIVLHYNVTSFISIDDENNSAVCYAVGLRAPKIRKEDYAVCAICNSIPTEYCNVCNRLLCKKCCQSGKCLYCQSLSLYL